jgi:hypothetical protein
MRGGLPVVADVGAAGEEVEFEVGVEASLESDVGIGGPK